MQLDRSPRAVPDATHVAKIACGAFHNLALTKCAVPCQPLLASLCNFYPPLGIFPLYCPLPLCLFPCGCFMLYCLTEGKRQQRVKQTG